MMWSRDFPAGEEDGGYLSTVVLNSFYNDKSDPCLDWILMNWTAGLSREIVRSSLVAVLIWQKMLVQLDLMGGIRGEELFQSRSTRGV